MRLGRIHDEFPAPSYRGHQQSALTDIAAAFEDGAEVVLVRAPTGSGKSLLARAICGCGERPAEADPGSPTGAYYTTPQVSQLDAVAEDPLLDDVSVVRGKGNYTCALSDEPDTPVPQAPCERISGYQCSIKHRCPYYVDRDTAEHARIAGMTLAYFMQTAGSGTFGPRDVVVIDEAHGLAEWAETYATIELSETTVPGWDPSRIPDEVTVNRQLLEFAKGVRDRCQRRVERLVDKEELLPAEAARRDQLRDVIRELDWFCRDVTDTDSPTTWIVEDGEDRLAIKPLDPARFLHRTVWDRGRRFALLSATILDKTAFCRRVGLDPSTVRLVDVPHTFPLENRPLYDLTQGRMTMAEREETLPKVANALARVFGAHEDEKGIVHCHSYAIQSELADRLRALGEGNRIVAHDRENRDDALAAWQSRNDPAVFLSVKMEEALDLAGDLARFQVICKAPYPNVGDPAVSTRLADDQWAWYYGRTIRTVIQACGRVVRGRDDYGATYLVDESLLDVFDRTRGSMPAWFREQVDACTVPDLPSVDADSSTPVEPATDSDTTEPSRRSPMADVWDTD